MFLNLLLLSLLPLALGASTAPFLNPAFCNPAGADPSAMRVCFLNPSRQYIFQGYSSGLNVVYSADKNCEFPPAPHCPAESSSRLNSADDFFAQTRW